MLSNALHNLESEPDLDMVPQTAWFEKEHLLALPAEDMERLMPPGER